MVIVGKGEGRAVLSRLFSRGRAFPWKIRSPGKVSKNSEVRENVMRHFRKTLLYPRPDRPANENTTAAPQPDPPQHVEIPCAGGAGRQAQKNIHPAAATMAAPASTSMTRTTRRTTLFRTARAPRVTVRRSPVSRASENGSTAVVEAKKVSPILSISGCPPVLRHLPSRADPAHRPARRREPLPRSRREEPSTARRPSER